MRAMYLPAVVSQHCGTDLVRIKLSPLKDWHLIHLGELRPLHLVVGLLGLNLNLYLVAHIHHGFVL